MHSAVFNHATQAGTGRRGPYEIRQRSQISKARAALGLTQAEAAKRCGVSFRTYQRAEAGDVLLWATKCSIERVLGIRF